MRTRTFWGDPTEPSPGSKWLGQEREEEDRHSRQREEHWQTHRAEKFKDLQAGGRGQGKGAPESERMWGWKARLMPAGSRTEFQLDPVDLRENDRGKVNFIT